MNRNRDTEGRMSAPYKFKPAPWRPKPPPRPWALAALGWLLMGGGALGCWLSAPATDWPSLGAGLGAGMLLMDLLGRLGRD